MESAQSVQEDNSLTTLTSTELKSNFLSIFGSDTLLPENAETFASGSARLDLIVDFTGFLHFIFKVAFIYRTKILKNLNPPLEE